MMFHTLKYNISKLSLTDAKQISVTIINMLYSKFASEDQDMLYYKQENELKGSERFVYCLS